jgi:hypothetical protein
MVGRSCNNTALRNYYLGIWMIATYTRKMNWRDSVSRLSVGDFVIFIVCTQADDAHSSGVQLSSVLERFRLSDEDSAGKRAEESGSSFFPSNKKYWKSTNPHSSATNNTYSISVKGTILNYVWPSWVHSKMINEFRMSDIVYFGRFDHFITPQHRTLFA